MLSRDGFQCRYCGRKPPEVSLEVDHIKPRCAGGSDDETNLITACRDCNQGKSGEVLPICLVDSALEIDTECIDPRDSMMEVAYRDPFDGGRRANA